MANKLLKILEVKFDENLTPKQVNIGTATQTSERLFKLHVVVPNIDLQKDSCYVACELPVKKRYTNKTSKIKLPYNLNSQFEFYKTIDGIDYYHTYIDLDSRVLKYVGDIKLNVVIEHLTGEIVAIDYEDNESEYNQMEIVDTRSSETFTISVMRSSNYNENLYPEDEDEYDEAVVHIDAILKFLAAYQSYAPAKKDTLQVLDSKPSDISNLNGLYFFKDKNEVDFIKNGKVEQVIFEDQFLEFDSKNAFPIKGDYGRLYLDKSNNLLYVWNVELEKYLEILPLILKNNFKIEDGKITFYNSDSNEQYARVILSDDQIELRTRLDGEKARSFILNNDGLFLDQNKIATLDDISKLVNGAPETLNTLKELSDALNNDANFATNVLKLINNLENKKYDKTGGRISGYVDVDEINSKSGHFKVGRINNSEADTIDEDVVDTLEILGTQTFEYSPNDSFLNWNGNTVSTATGQIISDSNWQFEKDGIVGRGSSLICKDSYYRLQSSQWSPYHAYKFTFRALTTGRAKISLRILCNGYEIAYYKEGSNSENNSFSSLIRSDNVWKDFSVQLDQPVHGIITFEFRSNNDADSAKAIYIARLEILEAKGVSNKPNATFIDFQDDEVVSYYYGNLRYRYNSILNNVITNEKFTVLFDNSHEESFSKDTMFKIDKAEGDMTYKSRAYRVIYLNNGSYYTDSWIDTRHVETDPEQWQTRHDNGFKIYNEGEFEVAAWCLPNGIVPDSDDHLTPKIAQPLAGLRLSNDTSRFITYEGGTDVGSQYCGTLKQTLRKKTILVSTGMLIREKILMLD